MSLSRICRRAPGLTGRKDLRTRLSEKTSWTAVGLMSGSSCDGLDLGRFAIKIKGDSYEVRTLDFRTLAYPDALREHLAGLHKLTDYPDRLKDAASDFTGWMIHAVREALSEWDQLPDFIASHGHTAFHEDGRGIKPTRTLQIGDGADMAAALELPIVYDFRSADVAAGGSGAPLVPYVDWLLLARVGMRMVALNIGGIANVTLIPESAAKEDVTGGDVGPGNVLLDACMCKISCGKVLFDRDGSLALKGRVDNEMLRNCMERLPQAVDNRMVSLGREDFCGAFFNKIMQESATRKLSDEDLMATLAEVTVQAVARNVRDWLDRSGESSCSMLVSGGGAHNQALMQGLVRALGEVRVETSESVGIHSDAKEALAFAVLGLERIRRRQANLSCVTGAHHPCLLGRIAWSQA